MKRGMERTAAVRWLMVLGPALGLAATGCGAGTESTTEIARALTAPAQVSTFVFLATGHVAILDRTVVTGGNVGVGAGASGDSINAGLDTHIGVGKGLIGQRIVLQDRAVAGDLFATTVVAPHATFASRSPFSAPPVPPPIAPFTAGTAVLTVAGGQTVTRAAGNFGAVTVNGTLNLSGGTYQFQSLTLGPGGALIAQAASIVRVAGRVSGADRARIVSAGTLGAGALRLIVAGATNTTGGVGLGNDARLTALVVSRAAFTAGDRLIASGAVAASDISLAHDSTFTFNTGFGCDTNAQCNDSNACTNDSCLDAQCVRPNATNGTACPLPNASATCSNGTCTLRTCNAGFGNCDGVPQNGCEVNTNTTVGNCGTCGHVCSFANAGASCSAGACVIGTCNTGFGNCNGDPADGCEVNTTSSPGACGACGQECLFDNAEALCVNSTCQVGACNDGNADCDGTPGCEVTLSVDPNNCGACGHKCSFPNAAAACVNGACALATCNAGFGNCNGSATDGCETPLDTLTNCGACGAACTFANGAPSCATGTCTGTCSPGFSDCDGSAGNGCETNLTVTCNACTRSAGCDFSNSCQGMHPEAIHPGTNVGKVVTLTGFANAPGAEIVAYALALQDSVNPANSCDLTAADPNGDPDPTQIDHYVWRLLNLTFSGPTATFGGLFPWTMNVTVIPTTEPATESQRWPEGGLARIAIQGISLSPSGVADPNSQAAVFADGCVNAGNASLSFPQLVAACAPTTFQAPCKNPVETLTSQIVTLVDTDPVQGAPPAPFCPDVLHSYVWDEEPPNLACTDYTTDSNNYYAALDSDPGYPGVSGTTIRDTSTLPKWLTANGFPAGEVRAAYYNAGDIGVGRDMHCRRESSGAIACYVSNYKPAVFAPTDPATDPETAANNAIDQKGAEKAATVAMEFLPNAASHVPSDPVRFWVFDGDDIRQPVVTLDIEGNKPVPGVCLSCHGGTYPFPHPTAGGKVQSYIPDPGARFLPFDTCSFSYSTERTGFSRLEQEDNFRKLNAMVLETLPSEDAATPPPAGSTTELLYGLYGIGANTALTPNPLDAVAAGTEQNKDFVPAGWQGKNQYYLDVVKPFCRTCHTSQEIKPVPASAFTNPAFLLADLCSNTPLRRMPHARQTLERFWGASGRANLVNALNTGLISAATTTGACPAFP